MAAKYSLLLSVKTLGAQGIKRLGNSMQGLAGKVKNAKLTFDGLAKAYVSLRAVQDTLNKSVQREESIRRLNLLAQGFDNLAAVQTAAGNAATKFGVSQTQANKEFAQIYARLRPIGLELKDIVTVYEGFNTAAKLSGTSASEASGAFLQLSQALGTGVLRGQELNSVFEQTPAVVQAIAKEMGVTVGEIRDLAKEGKVTIDYILPALERLRTEGAEKLTEAMKGPAQQFRNLNIAVEELQIAAVEDNLTTITDGVKALTGAIKILNKAIKSDEFKGFMDFLRFGFDGNPFDNKELMKELEINRTRRESQTMDLSDPETGTIGRRFRPKDIEKATDSLKKLNDEWKKGAQDGLTKYREGMKDISTRVSDMVVNSFKKMEDALTDFVTGGKLSFKDLANSIIKDMIRIQIQQSVTGPLSSFIGSLFTPASIGSQVGSNLGGHIAGAKASGGPVRGGSSYLVGERGMEIFTPKTSGNITPNHQLGGNTSVVVNVDASGTDVQGNDQQANQLGRLISIAVQSELIKQRRPGGLLTA